MCHNSVQIFLFQGVIFHIWKLKYILKIFKTKTGSIIFCLAVLIVILVSNKSEADFNIIIFNCYKNFEICLYISNKMCLKS